MMLFVEVSVEPKDEPAPGALAVTADNVVGRMRDVLGDVFKHDEVVGWTLRRIELVGRPLDPQTGEPL